MRAGSANLKLAVNRTLRKPQTAAARDSPPSSGERGGALFGRGSRQNSWPASQAHNPNRARPWIPRRFYRKMPVRDENFHPQFRPSFPSPRQHSRKSAHSLHPISTARSKPCNSNFGLKPEARTWRSKANQSELIVETDKD